MKGRVWGGTVLSVSLAFFVFAGGSYGEEKKKSAPPPARPAPRPAPQMAPRPAPQARPAPRPAPQMAPRPAPQARPAPQMAPRPRPPEPMHANVPGPAAGGMQGREDLHRKMAVQVSRQENLRAAEHYKAQRAMFRPMPHPVRFSPAAHRALFARVRMAPATYHYRRDVFYAHYHYAPPPYVSRMYPVYGIWDAAFLGFMLEHAMETEYALMYYNHQNEEGMQEWRAEMNQLAVDNAALRDQLAALDSQVASLQGTPVDPSYIPEDAQDIALAPEVVEQMGAQAPGQGA